MKPHDFGIYLACHQRTQDLLCHLDRLKYLPIPHEAFVLYSGAHDLGVYVPNLIRFHVVKHAPVAGVLTALKDARQRGIKWILYNNGDDILFRNDIVAYHLCQIRENDYDLCGYSWYGQGRISDITVNELYMNVAKFDWLDVDKALENLYARESVSIEHELASVLRLPVRKLFRLSDREIPRGIGLQTDGALDHHNNRWFHRNWQMITSHDPWQRWEWYKSIRPNIPYHAELERERFFGAWVNNCMKLDQIIPEIIGDKRTLLGGVKLFWLGQACLETRGLPGDICEVGIYRAGVTKMLAMLRPEATVHGFDTFTGIPHEDEAKGEHRQGDFACGLLEVQEYLADRANVVLHQGIFPQTAKGLEDRQFSFVHVDCDTYQSTLASIDFFWPRMTPLSWMVFDDWNWPNTPGVNQALLERFDKAQIQTRPESDNQAFIQKPLP